MRRPRRLCVITGTRAEYGLLSRLMMAIHQDPDLELQLVVTGMHLAPEFGSTYREIEADGLPIAAKVDLLLASDSPVAIAKSIGLGTIGFADAFERLKPDLLVVLGDRFEILAAVQAALIARIPVAHLSGGEATEGVIDDAIRHAITKMSHFHFVTAEPYRQRVIQLGEDPERVFAVGEPGLDHLRELQLMDRVSLEASLKMKLGSPLFLLTYHPVTLAETDQEASVREVLAALLEFPEASVIITKPNADTDGRSISKVLEQFAAEIGERVKVFASLGQKRYLSALKLADVVVGNSSSGIVEAPFFGVPTVNIGPRQEGRLKARSVIDAPPKALEVAKALRAALNPEFRAGFGENLSLYGDGKQTSRVIKDRLKNLDLQGAVVKKFHDLRPLR